MFGATAEYDPRYDRAQTVKGAKARYVSDDCPAYDIITMEQDIERILVEGEYPDKVHPGLKGQKSI